MKYSRKFTAPNGETSVEEIKTELSKINFVNGIIGKRHHTEVTSTDEWEVVLVQ
tara:strand:+ start:274 stop:435 length:162 start_codon:yes stop_codon:yes gene_type:complete